MPRTARAEIFRKPEDYAAFLTLLRAATGRVSVRVLAHCLMSNHFHVALWPKGDGDLSRFLQWLLTAQVRQYHQHYKSRGHVSRGRFKAFPIQQDGHLLTVLQYIERNPLRAGMVARQKIGCGQACGSDEGKVGSLPVPRGGPAGLGGVGECPDDGCGSRGAPA